MEGMHNLSQDGIGMADLAAQAPAAHYVAQMAGTVFKLIKIL